MTELAGVVLDVHRHGALVRLVDGRLAALPARECDAHRDLLRTAAFDRRALPFVVDDAGRRPALRLAIARDVAAPAAPRDEAPQLVDPAFEAKISAFLRSCEDGFAPDAGREPAEREQVRKTRRARRFEAPPGRA